MISAHELPHSFVVDLNRVAPWIVSKMINPRQSSGLGKWDIFIRSLWSFVSVINLRHRRWSEVTVFTPVCLFVCEQYYGKTPGRISTKLGGGIRYGPRIMPLDFGLGPKKIFFFKKISILFEKYLNFFFCISTCFKWFPTPPKKIVREKKILQLFFNKISIFFFCISTCYKWFPTKNMPKL